MKYKKIYIVIILIVTLLAILNVYTKKNPKVFLYLEAFYNTNVKYKKEINTLKKLGLNTSNNWYLSDIFKKDDYIYYIYLNKDIIFFKNDKFVYKTIIAAININDAKKSYIRKHNSTDNDVDELFETVTIDKIKM